MSEGLGFSPHTAGQIPRARKYSPSCAGPCSVPYAERRVEAGHGTRPRRKSAVRPWCFTYRRGASCQPSGGGEPRSWTISLTLELGGLPLDVGALCPVRHVVHKNIAQRSRYPKYTPVRVENGWERREPS